MSIDVTKAMSDRSFWSAVADIGSVAVLIGVIFELVVEFETLTKFGTQVIALLRMPAGRGRRRKLGKLGALLLIAGLAVEYLGTSTSQDITGEIEGQLSVDTSVAIDRAKQAELALAKFKAPRLVTSDQMTEISGRLKLFQSTPCEFALRICRETNESR